MNKLIRGLILLASLPALAMLNSCSNYHSFTQAQNNNPQTQLATVTSTEPFNYNDYAAVLKTYVNGQGLVDYKRLQVNREQLDLFNARLGNITASTYDSWSEKEKIAFWINAYNAFTLQSIIDQNPIKDSIRDIPGVWKIRRFNIAEQSKTLDNIEHDTIRVDFNEPRIHVALVCAAISCPPLRNEPYTAEKLDVQLDEQVRNFISSPHGFKINRQEGRIYLSSIFKWYGDDWKQNHSIDNQFTGNDRERAVLNFLSSYLSSSDKAYLVKGFYQVNYLDYDWSLNQQ